MDPNMTIMVNMINMVNMTNMTRMNRYLYEYKLGHPPSA